MSPPSYEVRIISEEGVLPMQETKSIGTYTVTSFDSSGAYLTLHGITEVGGDSMPLKMTIGINHDKVTAWRAEKQGGKFDASDT